MHRAVILNLLDYCLGMGKEWSGKLEKMQLKNNILDTVREDTLLPGAIAALGKSEMFIDLEGGKELFLANVISLKPLITAKLHAIDCIVVFLLLYSS